MDMNLNKLLYHVLHLQTQRKDMRIYMYAFMSHYTLNKSMHIETYLHCSNHTEGTRRLYFETNTRYIHILIYGN